MNAICCVTCTLQLVNGGAERTATTRDLIGQSEDSTLPALIPVGGEQDQNFPAISVQVGEHPRKAILESLLYSRVGCFQVFEHIQILLAILEILGQEAERLEMIKFPRSEKP